MEVAWLAGGEVGVRDSKNPTGPALVLAPSDWDAFPAVVMDGDSTDRPEREASATRFGPRRPDEG
ncbi:DUF397 domain-containing protein [Nocardia sp. NBC_01503]|uniref:DUF397 domain-containing protein n=1 Tax=Nocardia sp. NBC_01503 TaxID=2975997 RepID=UPI003FA55607